MDLVLQPETCASVRPISLSRDEARTLVQALAKSPAGVSDALIWKLTELFPTPESEPTGNAAAFPISRSLARS